MTRSAWLPLAITLLFGCPTSAPDAPDPPAEQPALTGSLQLSVLDVDGLPVDGAFVTVWPLGFEESTDAEGLAAFVLPAGSYRLTLAALGLQTTTVEAVELAAEESVELEVTLLPGQTLTPPALRVELLSAANRPLADVRVRVGEAFEGSTSAEGVLVFSSLPAGEHVVQVLPELGAAPWSAAITLEEGAITLLPLRLSGAPGDAATWTGSEACTACHEEDHALWLASAHGSSWSPTAPAGLAPLLDSGLTADVVLPGLPEPVQVTVFRVGGTERITLHSRNDQQTWDLLGWMGAGSSVPLIDLPAGPAPAPVIWRSTASGDLAEPAFAAGLVGFRAAAWFDFEGRFVAHADTGGPAPSELEAAACLGCHAVGFALEQTDGVVTATATSGDGAALERGVACEACHGPGSEHVAAGEDEDGGVDWIVNPRRLDPDAALDVCGACHSAGLATAELGVDVAFPYGDDGPWRPSRELASYLEPAPRFWPDGAAAGPNQQVDELRLSPHGGDGVYALGCGECHRAHGPSDGVPRQLILPSDDNSLCLGCHETLHFEDEDAVIEHTGHSGYDPAGAYASGRCTGCHMPATASRDERSAATGGGRLVSHQVAIQRPSTSLAAFETSPQLPLAEVPPNACLACHRWTEIRYGALGVDFHGPAGEPTERATYVTLSAVFELMFGGDE